MRYRDPNSFGAQRPSLYSDGAESVGNGYKVYDNILPPRSLISLVRLPKCHIIGIEWIRGAEELERGAGGRTWDKRYR